VGRAADPAAPPALDARRDLSASALAYVGDSVWELAARARLAAPPRHLQEYRGGVERLARAETQAAVLSLLERRGLLTGEEKDLARWARNSRNARGAAPKRFSRKHGTGDARPYLAATALEALVGFWFLERPGRLQEVFTIVGLASGEPAAGGGGGTEGQSPLLETALEELERPEPPPAAWAASTTAAARPAAGAGWLPHLDPEARVAAVEEALRLRRRGKSRKRRPEEAPTPSPPGLSPRIGEGPPEA